MDFSEDNLAAMTNDEIRQQIKIYESQISIVKSNNNHLFHMNTKYKEDIKDNNSKIKNNKILPYLVSHIVEVQ